MNKQLFNAVKAGDLEKVKYLVLFGADIRCENNLAVRLASEYGHLEIVKYLVSQGADIHSINNYAVRLASHNGHLEVVKYLVSLGANIHSLNNYAVRWAAARGHLELVKYLCFCGADFRSEYDFAIKMASKYGHNEVVNYLLSLCTDISKITPDHQKYILFCQKMEEKIKLRAQEKIYNWWIQICYNPETEVGQRMLEKIWVKFDNLQNNSIQ